MPNDAFPKHYLPMLASTGKEPFNHPDWIWEVKWDGYRMMCYIQKNKVELRSRNNKDYTNRFKIIVEDLKKWKHEAVLDGEMVVLDENGNSHFNSLENWYSPANGTLQYYVFDILWLDGKSLLTTPLIKRRAILKKNFPKSDLICYNDYFNGMQGLDLYEKANQFKLEGIIGKKKDSEYYPDARTDEWRKVKITQLAECIIVGFTKVTEKSATFSRLLLAIPDGKKFQFIGSVGSGFTQRSYKEIEKKLTVVKNSPFEKAPDPNKATRFRRASTDIIYWVKPVVKCYVQYSDITNEGVLRHPSFKGLVTGGR
jgi:bifunctional non-homologous end joining protein LigD